VVVDVQLVVVTAVVAVAVAAAVVVVVAAVVWSSRSVGVLSALARNVVGKISVLLLNCGYGQATGLSVLHSHPADCHVWHPRPAMFHNLESGSSDRIF